MQHSRLVWWSDHALFSIALNLDELEADPRHSDVEWRISLKKDIFWDGAGTLCRDRLTTPRRKNENDLRTTLRSAPRSHTRSHLFKARRFYRIKQYTIQSIIAKSRHTNVLPHKKESLSKAQYTNRLDAYTKRYEQHTDYLRRTERRDRLVSWVRKQDI